MTLCVVHMAPVFRHGSSLGKLSLLAQKLQVGPENETTANVMVWSLSKDDCGSFDAHAESTYYTRTG